jgi:hypothetical protein
MSRRFSDDDLRRILLSPSATDAAELAHEVQHLHRLCFDERVKRGEKLVEHLLSECDSYHNHKETMAHAALLVMMALSGGVLSLHPFPPLWVPPLDIYIPSRWIAFLGFFLLWALIHVYIRWQLRNRRWAAVVYAGAFRAIGQWVQKDPAEEDLATYRATPRVPQGIGRCIAAKLSNVLDMLVIPFPRAGLPENITPEDYPAWVGKAVHEQDKKGTGAIWSEWLITGGSFLLLVIVFVRTFYS